MKRPCCGNAPVAGGNRISCTSENWLTCRSHLFPPETSLHAPNLLLPEGLAQIATSDQTRGQAFTENSVHNTMTLTYR